MGAKSRGNWPVTSPQPVYRFREQDISTFVFQGREYTMRLTHLPTGLAVRSERRDGESTLSLRQRLLAELDAMVGHG